MFTTALRTKNLTSKTGVYIKVDFKKDLSLLQGELPSKKEKAIVKDIFQSFETNLNVKDKTTYTLQQGDEKKLSKNGELTMYNINKPITIPVGRLLGKWKKSHVGVTLIVLNGQWRIREHHIH